MTFPIPPLKPETESLEMTALSPSSKVFVAATIIFIGSVVAMIHAQIPVASLANLPNEVVDQSLVAAPLPDTIDSAVGTANSDAGELQPDLRVALAELKRESFEPTMAAGNAKYTQAYPQPQLAAPNYPQSSAAEITEPKPLSLPAQNNGTNQGSNEYQNNTKIKSVDFRPMQTDTQNIFNAENNNTDTRKTSKPIPTVTPATEVSDSMLPLFQFAENLKSSQQSTESIPSAPVDLFQAKPEMVPIHTAPPNLVPLTRAKN
ncbi:MAG: hypothetical protein LBJ00_15640 [Planctomycetaceae bacterium]|jgi:hypothetical protein|nr:hypothetical protein [Planctomycetaceae bacterium]